MAEGAPVNKRQATSPPMMEGSAKRQPILSQLPTISLESDTDHLESEEVENTTLVPGLEGGDQQPTGTEPPPKEDITLAILNEKVDRVLKSFEIFDKKLEKNANKYCKKFLNIQEAHNTAVNRINTLNDRAETAEDYNEQTRAMVNDCLQKINEMALKSVNQEHATNTRLESVEKSVIELGTEIKEKKLIISGVKEEKGENVRQVVLKSIKKALSVAKAAQEKEDYEGTTFMSDPSQISLSSLDQVYRIGAKFGSWQPRNILVSFKDAHHRHILLKTKSFLAEDESVNFFLEEDMTPLTRAHRSYLKRIAAAAKSENLEVKQIGNKINIDGTSYGINDLDTIPDNVASKLKQEKEVGDGIAFRGRESILSSFFMTSFEVDGTSFNCVEQYYQHTRAIAYKNYAKAKKIIQCTDPRRIKEIGDGVKYDADWLPSRVSTLYTGAMAKFQQNPSLAIALISTGSSNLYEATTDRFFGCGIGLQSKKWANKSWTGENVAGRILMKIRAELTGASLDDDLLVRNAESSISSSLIDVSSKHNATDLSYSEATQMQSQAAPSSQPKGDITDGKSPKRKKHSSHKGNRGRGRSRGSSKSSNVTERSSRRQSANKLTDKDLAFLNVNSYIPHNQSNKAHTAMEVTTSTPKGNSDPRPKQLSDSELRAMGVDPSSGYAADIRQKYSVT